MHPETKLEYISKENSQTIIVIKKLTQLLAKKMSNLSIHGEGAMCKMTLPIAKNTLQIGTVITFR